MREPITTAIREAPGGDTWKAVARGGSGDSTPGNHLLASPLAETLSSGSSSGYGVIPVDVSQSPPAWAVGSMCFHLIS